MSRREQLRADGSVNLTAATVPGTMVPLGYQQITSLASVQALTVPAGATFALIQASIQPVRWRDDGINPSATVGMPLAVGSEMRYDGDLAAIRFIESSALAVLNVSYYG